MNPARRAISLAAAAIAATALSAVLLSRGALDGGFRIDEAHKISETVFLRLLVSGRVADPLWFAHIVDRTNPPAGKYLLGAGIALQGLPLPAAPSLSHRSADGSIPALHTPAESAPYLPLLRAARRTALAATALAAALVAWTAARAFGPLAAAVASLLFIGAFAVQGWGATAVFDPFLAAAFAGTLALAGALPARPSEGPDAGGAPAPRRGRAIAIGIAAGIVAAIASQIRLSGLAALGAFLVAAAFAYRRELARLATCAVACTAAFAIAAVAMNPYYWATARAGIPEALHGGALPGRIAGRIALQLRELGSLFALVASRNATLRTPGERLRFTAEIAFGDLAGIALLFGLLAFLGFAGWRLRRSPAPALAVVIASAALAVAYVGWLPLPWPRYLLPMMPPFALLGAAGWRWVAETAARAFAAAAARGTEARIAR